MRLVRPFSQNTEHLILNPPLVKKTTKLPGGYFKKTLVGLFVPVTPHSATVGVAQHRRLLCPGSRPWADGGILAWGDSFHV